jgi:KUP system potassium uptake protein
VHINRTEEPYTLTYDVSELADDKVIRININLGFRVQPKTDRYFKQIIRELVAARELNLHLRPDGATRYHAEPDFRFVVLEKFLSVENELPLRDGLLLNAYFLLKHLGLGDVKAFGLEKSDVVTEQVPLLYQPAPPTRLTRINHKQLQQ